MVWTMDAASCASRRRSFPEISRSALAQIRVHLPAERSNGLHAVVACVEGELHDLGARIVSDLLEMAGFEVCFLGANVPTESLVELVRRRPPHLLALSVAADSNLPALRRAVAAVRSVTRDRVRIAVGGQALVRKPSLVKRLGVGIHARDARGTVAAVRQLFKQ